MYEGAFLDRYRKLRKGWWLGLSAAWIGGWVWFLTRSDGKARDCSGMLGDMACATSDGITTISVALGIAFALLTTPLLLIPASFFARQTTDQEVAADAARVRTQEEAEAAARAASQRKRQAQLDQQAQANRSSIHRSEFLQKLGAVSDLLRLLADEDDKTEIRQLKVGVAQSLRDLTAKHTLDGIVALIRGDRAIRLALPPVLDALEDARLDTSPEAKILDEAMAQAIANA
jgi:hypothetical protein